MKKNVFLPPFISRVYPHVIYKSLQPNTISFNLAICSCSNNLKILQKYGIIYRLRNWEFALFSSV